MLTIVNDFLILILIVFLGITPIIRIKKHFNLKLETLDLIVTFSIISFSMITLPSTILGIDQYNKSLSNYIYILALLSLLSVLFFLIRYLKIFFTRINQVSPRISAINRIYVFLLVTGLATFFLHTILLPLRGYDSLYLYIPQSHTIQLLNSIPLFNPLNFTPMIKEPFNSLLYLFSLQLTGQISVTLVILLIITLWSLVTYQFSLLVFPKNKSLALTSMLMFLMFPLTLWFVDQWFYYQDIFLGFFFTASIYFFLKSSQAEEDKYTYFYSIMSALAFALALISKISAWTLLLILIPLYLLFLNRKSLLIAFISILFVFLSFQGSTRLFIGLVPVFIIILALLMFHIYKYENYIKTKFNYSFLLLLGISIPLGGYWLFHVISSYPPFLDFLYKSYADLSSLFALEYPSITFPEYNFALEHAHRSNFFSLILVFMLGNLFAAFWALPKLIGFLRPGRHSILVIWVLIFFPIWLVYHSISIRYLTPIITPLIILALVGFVHIKHQLDTLLQKTKKSLDLSKFHFSNLWILFILVTGLVSLYFPIPLENFLSMDANTIGRAYLESAYIYYSNWHLAILLLVFLPIIIFLAAQKSTFFMQQFTKFTNIIQKHKSKITGVFLAFIIIFPNFVLFSVLVSANFDIEKTGQLYLYENREAVMDVVDRIIADNNPTGAILTYNTPGLIVWTGQPTLDLYSQKKILNPLFTSPNITEGLDLLLNPYSYILDQTSLELPADIVPPAFDYILVPNYGHFYYSDYLQRFRYTSYLFSLIEDPQYFKLMYENKEFRLFKRIFTSPLFVGPYEIGLSSNSTDFPVVGIVPTDNSFSLGIKGYLKLDFSNHREQLINLTVLTSIMTESGSTVLNNSYTNVQSNKLPSRVDWSFNTNETFSIGNSTVKISFVDQNNFLQELTWVYETVSPIVVTKYFDTFSINEGSGLTLRITP